MENISAAIKLALQMEHKGYDLYMKAAQSTLNRLGRATLEAIAKKELDHIKAIEGFSKGINLTQATADIDPKDQSYYLREIMDKLAGNLEKQVKPDSDLERAYKVALDLEKASFELYKKLNAESSDPQAKKFFEFLMGEENTHFEILSDTLEYLNDPGEWYRLQERWIVEGG
ncbi:ferritin family protein [Candidatus Saganbacteria bacterium]|nr:ferritin family protein [Candidatus Saganbacteria bacterium]